MTVKAYNPDAPEVTDFRRRIYEEDLGLTVDDMSIVTYENKDSYDAFAYWYCDQKFLSNGFDQVLIYYYEGEPAGMCCGTHYNKNLYRGLQMYYILKSFRGKKDCNNLAGRHDGMLSHQMKRADELGCKKYFISMHTYDRRHQRYWEGLKRDTILGGIIHPRDRQFSAKDFIFLEDEYPIMYVNQKVFYCDLCDNDFTFDELFYDS